MLRGTVGWGSDSFLPFPSSPLRGKSIINRMSPEGAYIRVRPSRWVPKEIKRGVAIAFLALCIHPIVYACVCACLCTHQGLAVEETLEQTIRQISLLVSPSQASHTTWTNPTWARELENSESESDSSKGKRPPDSRMGETT